MGLIVIAVKDMSLTPEEAEQRWREQLRSEAERRADFYSVAVAEYLNKRLKSVHLMVLHAAKLLALGIETG